MHFVYFKITDPWAMSFYKIGPIPEFGSFFTFFKKQTLEVSGSLGCDFWVHKTTGQSRWHFKIETFKIAINVKGQNVFGGKRKIQMYWNENNNASLRTILLF